ncbi:hypothetical protein Malapachy_2501 [Malassezia pachydermatis]|uniref:Uncharacterized protein n=1 Tax=Malassezia pachydermatis TaxID=77020 RepID=A0A0M8MS67_9BASI|nr:hypothetical protein Malapachy_2501 [Malassezia pachydermatis]KOS15697.1 hypothetical protein Malapachy_2501 [Malassezia pachydermatis]
MVCCLSTMPSAKDIRARNELFAKKARETQNLRGSKGPNKRGLLHTHEERQKTSKVVQYTALFFLVLLGGGFVMEMLFLFMRSLNYA